MYKIICFRYESVIQKNFARRAKIFLPPQSQIRSYGLAIDHKRIISRLYEIGIRGTALNWFCTYLSGRTQPITIEDVTSDAVPLATGVPQGSVLGPILFLIYIQPLSEIISGHNISRHCYADDTQLYTIFSLKDDSGLQTAISKLEQCILDVRKWLIENKQILSPRLFITQ